MDGVFTTDCLKTVLNTPAPAMTRREKLVEEQQKQTEGLKKSRQELSNNNRCLEEDIRQLEERLDQRRRELTRRTRELGNVEGKLSAIVADQEEKLKVFDEQEEKQQIEDVVKSCQEFNLWPTPSAGDPKYRWKTIPEEEISHAPWMESVLSALLLWGKGSRQVGGVAEKSAHVQQSQEVMSRFDVAHCIKLFATFSSAYRQVRINYSVVAKLEAPRPGVSGGGESAYWVEAAFVVELDKLSYPDSDVIRRVVAKEIHPDAHIDTPHIVAKMIQGTVACGGYNWLERTYYHHATVVDPERRVFAVAKHYDPISRDQLCETLLCHELREGQLREASFAQIFILRAAAETPRDLNLTPRYFETPKYDFPCDASSSSSTEPNGLSKLHQFLDEQLRARRFYIFCEMESVD